MSARGALPFLALVLALALGLFALMRDRAFHPTDDGFVLAYSWRIAQGEVAYRDFIYVRPPLTPYLHAAWLALPEGWQIPAGRLAFYLELAAAALLPTAWAVARGLRAQIPALALVGATFLLSLHNFPPMPWPTVDGVFFGSAAVTACLVWYDRGGARWVAAATALATAAALAKQSFVPLAVLILALALAVAAHRRDGRAALAALAPPSLVALALAAALAAVGALAPFLEQLGEPARLRPGADHPWTGDLFTVGVAPYLALPPAMVALLPLLAIVFALRDERRLARLAATPLVFAFVIAAALALPGDTYRAGILLLLGAAAVAAGEAIRVARGRPATVPLVAYVLVLGTGWCASLSFAYQTPLLAIGMVAPVVAAALPSPATGIDRAAAAAALAVVAAVVLALNVALPYRDLPVTALTADLGEVYPRFGRLYTNPVNAARHRELRDLSSRFALDAGRDFVVVGGFPLAYFLSGSRSPLSLDWLEPQEYAGNEERLRRELDAARPVLIVQRQHRASVGAGAEPWSCAVAARAAPVFAREALAGATLAFEGRYFCVYVPD